MVMIDDDDVDDVDDSGNGCRGNERIKARQNERRRRKWNDEVEQLPRVVNPVVRRLSRTPTSTNALSTNAPPRTNTHHQPKQHWETCTTYAPIIKLLLLNNFKPPCKTRAPRVSWSIYWFCATSITFAFNLRSLDGCPHIFVHGHVWLQQHCLTTERHLPCILFPFLCNTVIFLVQHHTPYPEWQKLADFAKMQKWQQKFSSGAYLLLSRKMCRCCA